MTSTLTTDDFAIGLLVIGVVCTILVVLANRRS